MDWATKCAGVIPCFNEQASIGSVIAGLRKHINTILVVDDGSSDETQIRAEQAGGTVLRHPFNLGKGASLRSGCNWAHERGLKWALTLDGDGQHSPDDTPVFFSCAQRSSASLVVGNRMANASAMPWLRRHVNRWMSKRLSTLAGQSLPDSQCGFRLINLDAWSTLSLNTARFEIESEVLLAFIAAGYRVDFVPIQVIYKGEQSKIHPLRDTIRWFRWWKEKNSPRSEPNSSAPEKESRAAIPREKTSGKRPV